MKSFAIFSTVVLIILKVIGVITSSWWLVLAPALIVLSLHIVMGLVLLGSYLVAINSGTPEQRAKFKRIWDDQNREAQEEADRKRRGVSKWQIRMEQMQEARRKAEGNIPSVKTIILIAAIAGALASCSTAKNQYGCPANPIHKAKFKK